MNTQYHDEITIRQASAHHSDHNGVLFSDFQKSNFEIFQQSKPQNLEPSQVSDSIHDAIQPNKVKIPKNITDLQDNLKIVHRPVDDLLSLTLPHFPMKHDNFPCPLYPFCTFSSNQIPELIRHIIIFHDTELPFRDPFDKNIRIYLPILNNIAKPETPHSTTISLPHPLVCPFCKSYTELRTNTDLFTHLSEHFNSENTDPHISPLLSSGCFFETFLNFVNSKNSLPRLYELDEIPTSDTALILKKGTHYSDKPPQNPPWVAISADRSIEDRTPILMSDGGIICSPGQIMLNNGVVQNDNQSRTIVPASLFDILPRTNGEKPCQPPFILSQLNKYSPQLQHFMMMIYKILLLLNINPNVPPIRDLPLKFPIPRVIEVE